MAAGSDHYQTCQKDRPRRESALLTKRRANPGAPHATPHENWHHAQVRTHAAEHMIHAVRDHSGTIDPTSLPRPALGDDQEAGPVAALAAALAAPEAQPVAAPRPLGRQDSGTTVRV